MITLTDADILTLARTCPCLVVLKLGMRNTPASLCALGFFVRRSHGLREVFLRVDARINALGISFPNDNDNDPVGLQPNTCLFKLDIGESLISLGPLRPPTAPDLMRSIPRFLHAIAPCVERIIMTADEAWLSGKYGRRWKVVSNALSVMAKDAKDEVEDRMIYLVVRFRWIYRQRDCVGPPDVCAR
ncbi:uncharacterized protein EDB91DRAFT_882079 [Suillus paluster]|uniref:uncharacterized protein n=1 Tax=Suillus paluster TaxID=48578 RepID=UPI001B86A0A6|nr:uncharacterized protein EDB91DRAFT_882079 [Suillus paluster]KAG1748491.1 hypothetical protein EDB91DRAFT_882079 [Suillus paluster]